jgi:hypothetical protein
MTAVIIMRYKLVFSFFYDTHVNRDMNPYPDTANLIYITCDKTSVWKHDRNYN